MGKGKESPRVLEKTQKHLSPRRTEKTGKDSPCRELKKEEECFFFLLVSRPPCNGDPYLAKAISLFRFPSTLQSRPALKKASMLAKGTS